MGFNSVIFLINDAWHTVDKDPAGWWETTKNILVDTYRGVTKGISSRSSVVGEYGFGNHCNGFQGLWNQHADVCAVIVAGENCAEVVASFNRQYRGQESEDRNITALRAFADKLGFDIRKKPVKKPTKKT